MSKLGIPYPVEGAFESIEAELMFNILQLERDENNSGATTNTITGIYSRLRSGNIIDYYKILSDKEERDGIQCGIKLQTREKIINLSRA